jgi:HEAT repeat protein
MTSKEIILDTPDPPDDLAYSDFEDYRSEELLKVNDIELTEQSLLSALYNGEAVLQGASAHVLGKLGITSSVPSLKQLCDMSDDLVKVEAAYALVRLGMQEYRNILRGCLNYPLDSYLGPPIAAGDLARLGDSVGFPILTKCLDIDNLIVRTIACKQIILFLPFHGLLTETGEMINVYTLFDKALHDQHPEIQRIALMQMYELRTEANRNLIKNYLLSVEDNYLNNMAQHILDQMDKDC